MMNNKVSYTIPIPAKALFRVIKNFDLLFRLNIQWHLKGHNFGETLEKGSQYELILQDEKSERELKCTLEVEDFIDDNLLIIVLKEGDHPLRKFTFRVKEISADRGSIELEETRETPFSDQDRLELNLWVKSIINYAMISQSQSLTSRLWKFFLDKIYLKLSPTGRRIVFLVIISEIFALFFFILLVIYYLFFR